MRRGSGLSSKGLTLTDQTEYRPLGWRDPEWYAYGVKDGLAWMGSNFLRWFSSTTSFTFMWLAVFLAIGVLFFWDGTWASHQAPAGEGMKESFVGGGITVRLWTIFALVGAIACFRHKAYILGCVVSLTWLATSIMSYGHALGFVATGQMERYASGTVAEKSIEVKTTSNDDQIAMLERQKTEVRADRDKLIIPLNAEIERLDTDGKLNEDLATVQKNRRAELEDKAQEKLDAIDAQILALLSTSKVEQVESAGEVAEAVKFDPLYQWIGGWGYGKNPTDDELRSIAQIAGSYWALLIELIGGAGPAILYAAGAHFSDQRKVKASEAAKKGWETRRQKAERKDPNHTTPPQVEDTGYWQQRIMKALNNKMKRPTAKGLADSYFNGMSVEELRGRLLLHLKRGLVLVPATKSAPEVKLTHDHIDFIMREGEYAPEEQMTNGHDKSKGDSDEDDTGTDQLPATT